MGMRKATDTKNQALDDAEDYLNKLIDALHEIKAGTPESFVCKKYNLNKSSFRRLLFNEPLGYKGKVPKCPQEFLLSPEERLYCDVLGMHNLSQIDIPLDLKNSVKFVARRLGKRERRILFYRYWKEYTLEEIGELFGVTASRVRQVLKRALRKLRYPDSAKVLLYGLDYARQQQELRRVRSEEVVSKKIAALRASCKEAVLSNDKEAVVECLSLCKDFLEAYGDCDFSIDVLHLSTRPRKALARRGVGTIKELAKFKTTADLKLLPCVGDISAEEIRKKAALHGVVIERSNFVTL